MARYVTVGSVSHRPEAGPNDVDARMDRAAALAVRASRMGADIVAFPEIYIHLGVPKEEWPSRAEQVPGVSCSRMMEVARANSMYIIWPLVERLGSRLYNSAVLIDRQGQIAGKYHKMFPTIGEMDGGIFPGTEPRVFATDFGTIGMAICFDLNFPEVLRGLAGNGAEIVFFSSMYRGGLQLQSWAHELGIYLVSAVTTELGVVVDMSGQVLAESTYEAVITKRLNLDRRVLHMDYNWEKMDKMLAKYGPGIRFDYYTREAKYAIASERPDTTIDDLIQEFELEELADYFGRARGRRSEALSI